jgi:hypothetical protein
MHSQSYVLGPGEIESSDFTLPSKPWKMTTSLQQYWKWFPKLLLGRVYGTTSTFVIAAAAISSTQGELSPGSGSDASRINRRRTQLGLDFRSANRKLYESQNRGIVVDVFSTRGKLLEAALPRRRRRKAVNTSPQLPQLRTDHRKFYKLQSMVVKAEAEIDIIDWLIRSLWSSEGMNGER